MYRMYVDRLVVLLGIMQVTNIVEAHSPLQYVNMQSVDSETDMSVIVMAK